MASILRRFFGGAASNAGGYAIGGAITPALDPITQALANEMWARYPDVPLAPEEAANAVARGLRELADGVEEAGLSGTNEARLALLAQLAAQSPAIETVLDLWRRGAADEGDVDAALQDHAIRARWRDKIKALREYLVPPSDLVRMGVREVFNPQLRQSLDLDAEYPDAITGQGAKVGLTETSMRNYWAAHWELPSYTQGAEMLFRGEITEAQFNDLLKALDYSPTWRDKLANIARAIPSTQDFIRFAVREVFNPTQRKALGLDRDYPPEFTAKAALHGLSEQDARDYWAAHWQLPSPTQGYHMLWRGLIDAGELDGLLKALDYSPAWRDKLRDIAYLVPGRIDLRRMLAAGIIDRAEVKRGYQRLGYKPDDAETLTRFAEHLSTAAAPTTPWAQSARRALFNRAHREFLDESLDDTGARTALTTAGVPDTEQDTVLTMWNAERDIRRTELTAPQIRKAYRKGDYTQEQALAELAERGYTPEDAQTFLDIG